MQEFRIYLASILSMIPCKNPGCNSTHSTHTKDDPGSLYALNLTIYLFIGRNVEKDCIIDGQEVKKGTSLIVFVHLLHRNSSIWERPEEFIPERFLENT